MTRKCSGTVDRDSRMQYTYTASGMVKCLSYQEADGKVRTYENTYAADDMPTKNVLPDGSNISLPVTVLEMS